jgi:8-oxo-dGTP pyrophosphatase MutT (NUDIX family)
MSSPEEQFATPRIASGVLFVKGDKVLLVHKTYGNGWDIPGGYVDRGESPASACERELHEELGIRRSVVRLLVQDWAPSEAEGDKILYVFSCGDLGNDEHRIRVASTEIDKFEWINANELGHYVIPRLERRLTNAYAAHTAGSPFYLEHGQPRP